jgi:F0F1-type ATP synthase membrane subunit b/b'
MKILILLAMSGSAYASGDGHHASAWDLIPAAVNVSLLFGFLIYKLKTPATEFFKNKSSSVSEMIERAAVKAKEAKMMMEMQNKKMQGAGEEVTKLEKEADDQIASFKKNYEVEVQDRIKNMKEDAGQKIEAEKKELLDELNSNLLAEVIAKTKKTLKSNSSLGESATKSIIQGIK